MQLSDLIPSGLEANLRLRIAVRRAANVNGKLRSALIKACRQDVLFFMKMFCWLHEPRPMRDEHGRLLPKQLPFVPWPHQVPVIQQLRKSLGFNDVCIAKSRGEGATWICCTLALYDWLFDDMTKIGLVSYCEKMADDPGNMDSLMQKVVWQLENLPRWMVGKRGKNWERTVKTHSLVNYRNGCEINAFPSTERVGRGGRYKWFLCDEMAAWPDGTDYQFLESVRDTTNSRVIVSTPAGFHNAFARFWHSEGGVVKLRLHWSDNPRKASGLYRIVDGKPQAVDPSNPLHPDYEKPEDYVIDRLERLRRSGFDIGGLRSPWYDEQCDRADASPLSIARELDIDFGGSEPLVFGSECLSVAERTVQAPLLRGKVVLDSMHQTATFMENRMGDVLLWCYTDKSGGSVPLSVYVAGVDVSSGVAGSDSSNSVVTIIDARTGQQVLEWATNSVEPIDFADYCVALCRMFYDAYLIWETNGAPGVAFTKRVIDIRYHNIYMRKSLVKKGGPPSRQPGWYSSGGASGTRAIMLSGLKNAIRTGALVVRSAQAVAELKNYIWRNGQMVSRYTTMHGVDGSASGEAHGDRVVALALAYQGLIDRPVPKDQDRLVASARRIQLSGPMLRLLDRERAKAVAAKDVFWPPLASR